jgi:hypothetical protein
VLPATSVDFWRTWHSAPRCSAIIHDNLKECPMSDVGQCTPGRTSTTMLASDAPFGRSMLFVVHMNVTSICSECGKEMSPTQHGCNWIGGESILYDPCWLHALPVWHCFCFVCAYYTWYMVPISTATVPCPILLPMFLSWLHGTDHWTSNTGPTLLSSQQIVMAW